MMSTNKTSGKGLPSSTTVDFQVKPPFKIMEDNRRRFIRVDIDAPITFRTIKSAEGEFWPECDGPSGTGEILNISAGGILMFTEQPVMENSLMSMTMRLEEIETVDNILGLVKRTEIDSAGYLVGLESITREKLNDVLQEDEISKLPKDLSSFNERLQSLLNHYIFAKKLNDDLDEE
jgi:hypothetical protein